jgi:2-dehydro-3-deoxyphosphooctonate aldolase (KDO 8-P synthase)
MAAEYVDVCKIQLLVRQTDLVVAAAETGKVVNLKKASSCHQNESMPLLKVTGFWKRVMITDRGTMFGYQDMIVDFRDSYQCVSMHLPVRCA